MVLLANSTHKRPCVYGSGVELVLPGVNTWTVSRRPALVLATWQSSSKHGIAVIRPEETIRKHWPTSRINSDVMLSDYFRLADHADKGGSKLSVANPARDPVVIVPITTVTLLCCHRFVGYPAASTCPASGRGHLQKLGAPRSCLWEASRFSSMSQFDS